MIPTFGTQVVGICSGAVLAVVHAFSWVAHTTTSAFDSLWWLLSTLFDNTFGLAWRSLVWLFAAAWAGLATATEALWVLFTRSNPGVGDSGLPRGPDMFAGQQHLEERRFGFGGEQVYY